MADTSALQPGGGLGALPLILVADDQAEHRQILKDALKDLGQVVVTRDGREAVSQVHHDPPDLILLDVRMPCMDGIQVCRAVKQDPRTRLIPVVLLTGHGERETRIAGLAAGADDFFTKPFDLEELTTRARALLDFKRFTDQMDPTEATMTALALAVEARDPYTGGHCARVAQVATALGRALGLDREACRLLRLAGFLHDLGKVSVPDDILLKPGPLTDHEWAAMKAHAVMGEKVCPPIGSLVAVRPLIRSHHERWNGQGYPDGLAGNDIPLTAQILGLADVWDALITERPYKPALIEEEAQETLHREAARGVWNPGLLADFFHLARGA